MMIFCLLGAKKKNRSSLFLQMDFSLWQFENRSNKSPCSCRVKSTTTRDDPGSPIFDYECISLNHWLLKANGVSVKAPGAGAVGGGAAETPAVCCAPPGCACVPPTGLCVDAAVWPQLADRTRLGG